ncbi:unnamed protein product [Echinostoma caproni]|uniref:FYVE-type domain-containing protein n=1 Tax=Echinostoma caproni TaxID=27848 RepID=A0A183B555_9TREM|nr:unnamed protein product [Echinostoma caproni]
MLRERVSNRQWTKDDDVAHCSNCHAEFSLTNRKVNRNRLIFLNPISVFLIQQHHCRQCGGIFCHTCSSYRASIAASKDPVRVCGPCHAELTGKSAH